MRYLLLLLLLNGCATRRWDSPECWKPIKGTVYMENICGGKP